MIIKQQKERSDKKYYWEVCSIRQSTYSDYKQCQCDSKIYLYIYKTGVSNILVRIVQPIEKVYGWIFNDIEVIQKLNDNEKIYHFKMNKIYFSKGLLKIIDINNFNAALSFQIQNSIKSYNKDLQIWTKLDISDIYLIQEKMVRVNEGLEQKYVQMSNMIQRKYKNYYQITRWINGQWQKLLEIVEEVKNQQANGLDVLFSSINNSIKEFQHVETHLYKKPKLQQSELEKKQKVLQKKTSFQQTSKRENPTRFKTLFDHL